MSNTESLVTSLKLSRRLKEEGYPQEDSLYWWRYCTDGKGGESAALNTSRGGEVNLHEYGTANDFAAPIAEEILRRLPSYLDYAWLTIRRIGQGQTMEICYEEGQGILAKIKNKEISFFKDDSLSNIAAQMWLYLKEHNLLPPDFHAPQES